MDSEKDLKDFLEMRNSSNMAKKLDALKFIVLTLPCDYFAWSVIYNLLGRDDLIRLSTEALLADGKSYPAWNIRMKLNISGHDELTDKILEIDDRNFHCYRYMKLRGEVVPNNYFNYSCLHYILVDGAGHSRSEFVKMMYTDPEYSGSLAVFNHCRSIGVKFFLGGGIPKLGFTLRKYSNRCDLCFDAPFKGVVKMMRPPMILCDLKRSTLFYSVKNASFLDSLGEGSVISLTPLNGKETEFSLTEETDPLDLGRDLSKLMEICPSTVLYMIALKITRDMGRRKKIIDRLAELDGIREPYYRTLAGSFYINYRGYESDIRIQQNGVE